MLRRWLAHVTVLASTLSAFTISLARGDESVDMYVGAGCFWHVQKVVNMAEEQVLSRDASNISGVAGYAGGTDSTGSVCYTNYGNKGHTEVVLVKGVPRSRVPDMIRYIWAALFPGGDRSDFINRGPEYRAVLGLPGGVTGEFFDEVNLAQPTGARATLVAGNGNEGDTLGSKTIYVYDTLAFPFHQAELYHQFHDYKHSYEADLIARGDLHETSCANPYEQSVDLYIGAGCFWHVQKTVNKAEEEVLGRDASGVNGIAGYAGGTDNTGSVCYTNYDGKGHTEVVLVRGVPRSRIPDFVAYVWSDLFPGGDRSDSVNRGPEYRAALGIPGGMTSGLLPVIAGAQPAGAAASMAAGSGNDADTLGRKVIYVYDTAAYPFHQAEMYHQFHDYKHSYAEKLKARGDLHDVSCPSEAEALFQSPLMIIILAMVGCMVCGCLVGFLAKSRSALICGHSARCSPVGGTLVQKV